jgi:2-amino-4-hydroxy-6-hydroxymethyldihydropteridine diphosphokinase
MSLIIATGSNLLEREAHLQWAQERLSQHFKLIAASKLYRSQAVDYEAQPEFLNQVLQFALPWQRPEEVMGILLNIEQDRGRVRQIARGPRILDLDILFWGTSFIHSTTVVAPHPRWNQRSFVVRPLSELPFWHLIEKCFTIPKSFDVEAFPHS